MCTSTPGPCVADPHSTSWDNDQGCGHSDATTCFPIPQRHGRPLCRAGHAVYRLLIFPFSLRGAVLQQRQNGPNRFKPGAKSSRMAILPVGIAGADSGTSYFVGVAPKKGMRFVFSISGNFLSGGPGAIKNSTIGRSPSTIKCVLWFIPNR